MSNKMGDEDATSVIRMLNSFRRSTENRNSAPSLRVSTSGITPPLSMSMYNDSSLATPSSFRKNSISSSTSMNHTNDIHSSVTKSFIDYNECTPPKRQKLDTKNTSESNTNVPTSPWEWRRLKSENLSLRTRLSHQEITVQKLHQIRREIDQVFAKEKSILENKIEMDKSTIEQLEKRLELARKNTQETQESLSLVENELFQVKTKMDHDIAELTKKNSLLIEELRHANNMINSSSSSSSPKPSINDETEELELKLETAEDRIAELEEKLREHLMSKEDIEIQKITLQNAKLKIQSLENERALWEEGKALTARAARANELERELNQAHEMISSMREIVKGKLLLEEQMSNLKQRIEHTEQIEQQVATLEVQKNELINKLNEYEAIGIGNCPGDLMREINRLQHSEAVLTSEEGQLRSKVDSLQRENQLLQNKFNETNKIATDMTTSSDRLNKLVGRLQKRMLLVTRERDSYRQQLDLYEKEISTNDSTNAITERIPALEKSLEDYRNLVTKLEEDLIAISDPEIIKSKDECFKLREEIKKLKGELEHRALKGDFNCNAKILHFKMNPAEIASQLAEDKQKALLQEVEELRAMVQLGNAGVSGIASSSLYAQDVADLKQTHEIKIARLKEAFKVSSQEYRQACYQLFGWRVDRTKEGRYKLSSQYAESPDDYLFFQVGEGVDLLETAFSATLGELIERHLQIQHSVPMFLNAVQTELFSQQTMISAMT
ncbi:hypothetical protein HCN44_005427 [Aphidius gifuensis]|uniref:Mitotic spindle assembly checkpoint protein MAD1 n=1 Tax=Aphidius gifuensis TaxID=684658 RepID=A0A834Y332_APHGI|nr:mitotic spindle assembly checkpoint protein MAD1 [Aphidius gifuensis]KAF7997150.1 hypothetical protein HCN44_005427 [Aphidius gifuensis]